MLKRIKKVADQLITGYSLRPVADQLITGYSLRPVADQLITGYSFRPVSDQLITGYSLRLNRNIFNCIYNCLCAPCMAALNFHIFQLYISSRPGHVIRASITCTLIMQSKWNQIRIDLFEPRMQGFGKIETNSFAIM